MLARNSSNQKVLQVWDHDKIVTSFVLKEKLGPIYGEKLGKEIIGAYRYSTQGRIELAGRSYLVKEIDLNTDMVSGSVILETD